MKIVG
jgi:hypothetical protein